MANSLELGKLFDHKWMPEHPRAIVFIFHGIFEHGGRYQQLAEYLNANNIGVLSVDLPGHGRSPGMQGYIERWENLVETALSWLKAKKSAYPKVPHFLFGHSLGGLLAASCLAKERVSFDGVILTSPALQVKEDLSPILQKLAPIIASIAPKLRTIKLDAKAVSRDPEAVRAYVVDPLVYHGAVYAQTGKETLAATQEVAKSFKRFDWPVLIMHGTADRLTEPKGSQLFFEEISSTDKTIRLYQGWYHELFNEPEKEQVLEEISSWILERI